MTTDDVLDVEDMSLADLTRYWYRALGAILPAMDYQTASNLRGWARLVAAK